MLLARSRAILVEVEMAGICGAEVHQRKMLGVLPVRRENQCR
jgi:hypothetical protein